MSTPIMNQYLEAKKMHQDCLLFFRLGDFYELFFDDAKLASSILGITLTKRSQKNEDIPMAGVPVHTCDYYIAKLVKSGQKIAICEQIETSQNKSNKIIERKVVRIITPGTLTDDSLLNAKRNNFLVSLVSSNFEITAATFDLSTNEFFVQTFEPINLKDFLEKTEPSEILLTQNFIPQFAEYQNWKEKITLVQAINEQQALKNIVNFFNLHSTEAMNFLTSCSIVAISFITNYLALTQKQNLNNISLPKLKNNNNLLQLDKFTRRNLEITKTLQNEHKGSLLWLLDQTNTAQGGRLLFKRINEPITDILKLNKRYANIKKFIDQPELLKQTRTILKHIPDFDRLLSKFNLKRFNPIDLHNLAVGVENFEKLCKLLQIEIIEINDLKNKILKAISYEPSEKNLIQPNYDQEIDQLKHFEKDIDNQIAQLQEEYRQHTKIATLRIKFLTNLGYVIEISAANKEKLSYNFVLIQDLKNTARYMSSTLENINQKFANICESIIEKENEIINQLANEVKEHGEILKNYAQLSAKIDLSSNFAFVANENNFTQPLLTNDNAFEIKEGKHPVLDHIFKQKGELFVANDCNLDRCVMFMTGPNMAGKSTYLRQQALIALLAHIGSFVPAKFAKIGIIDHIFSRIGTNDNLIEGNSTFMMEMIEIGLTINQATNKSLIIFDEVGRGTSAEEGMAIAQAILEYLTNKLMARSLFATHYLKLKTVEHENLQKKMMEIIKDDQLHNQIHFTHKIIDGVAEKSWALSVAKIAGLPESIINRALELTEKNKN